LQNEEGHHAWGRYNSQLQRIEIDNNQPSSMMSQTIIHEILHAIESNIDLGLGETGVQILSNALHQLGIGEYLLGSIDLARHLD
tara:strand:- start:450 stop:701 length:252 start_codon:yes stop_codon:yes gene_type:complete